MSSDYEDDDPNEQARMESYGEQQDEARHESITLTQHLLGMRPYVLIEAKPDDDDPEELALVIAAGRVEADKIGYLPLLMLTSLPAETNPLTQAVRDILEAHPNHGPELPSVLAVFADYVGFPMPEIGPSC